MKKTKTSYLLKGAPSALLVLGAGFVMASSYHLHAAVGMGVVVILSLLLSAMVISALRKVIPTYAKLPVYLLIITGFVSLLGMLMEAWFPSVVDMLGVHLATLAVSAVIYRDAEEIADHHGEGTSIKTALITGLFFFVVMVVCAFFREALGNGTLWGYDIPFLKNGEDGYIPILSTTPDGDIAKCAFGGYLVLALVMAFINKVTGLHHHLEENEEKEDK